MINLSQLSTWKKLNEQEQYWAGYCARKLTDSGKVLEWKPDCVHQILLDHSIAEDMKELYTLDSLMCALTHVESKYAFRALLQAKGYISEGKFNYLNDCFIVAKTRIEHMLKF